MSLLSKFKDDPLLSKVLRSSGALFSTNTISLGLSVIQGALVARLLAPEGLGLLKVLMVYSSTINSIFSFRMGELVVRYGGEFLAKGEKDKASAIMKAAVMGELIVSFLAFLVVTLTAGLAENYFAKTPGTAWMFTVFSLGLLANFNYETSIGILQVTNKIKLQGVINLVQSIFTSLIILTAYLLNGTLQVVLGAYLLGKIILGLGMFTVAQIQLHRTLGNTWWKTPLSTLTSAKELFRFAISSNISATIIKVFRESELLWVAFFLSKTAVGYYSVAYTIVGFLAIPAEPLISTTFPEINRLVVEKAWPRLTLFLRKITTLSFAYNLALGLGLVFFGRWVIQIYSGEQFISAYPALITLTIGLVFNYTLFWNRPLLLSLGLPNFPIWATLTVGLIKVALAFWLVPKYGILAAGALLSYYYIASVGVMVIRGLKRFDKMKIAVITNSRIPSLTANSIQAMKVTQALMQLGHEIRMFAPRETESVSRESLAAHYGLRLIPDLELLPSERYFKRFDFIFHAQRAAKKFGADLIYTWLPQSAVIGLWAGYPVVLEMHADVTGLMGAWWLRQFWKAKGRKVMTVTTSALRNALERSTKLQFKNESLLVAPNGVELEKYDGLPNPAEARHQLNLPDGLTVGFTGHIYPGRGADLLFELAKQMPQVNFLWVGGTPELVDFWRSKLTEAKMTNVTMTGFVKHESIPLYQAASDVLLMPYSRSIEASSGQDIAEVINPMKMFEYMASGRAIISADLPSIREVLNEGNAVFVEAGNWELVIGNWKAAIESLLADESRRRELGGQARNALRVEQLTWMKREERVMGSFVG